MKRIGISFVRWLNRDSLAGAAIVCSLAALAISFGQLSIDVHHSSLGAEGLLRLMVARSLVIAVVLFLLALRRLNGSGIRKNGSARWRPPE